MKFFQRRWVAITLCIVMIVAAICIGQYKNRDVYRPEDAAKAEKWGQENAAAYETFLRDDGNLLSTRTEETLCAYNGAWDYSYESICGVATVASLDGENIGDAAFTLAEKMGLGSYDCLLLVDAETQEWYFDYGYEFSYYVNNELETLFRQNLGSAVTDADKQLTALFEDLTDWYADMLPVSGQAVQGQSVGMRAGGITFFVLLIVLLVIVAIVSAIIRATRRVAGGYGRRGPVVFFGGHRHYPPYGPGPGPRPGPGPGSGPRPGGSGSSSRSSGGGFGSSSRGGSSSRSSGGFGSSSRGGSSGRSSGGGFGSGKR